jgi:uncharacterized membrane protein YkoI
MKITHWIVAGVLAAFPLTVHADTDDNESRNQKVTMEELPAAVKATVQRETQGKKIESMTKEQKDGKTVYDIDFVSNGKDHEIEVSDTGKVLSRDNMHEEKTQRSEKTEKTDTQHENK